MAETQWQQRFAAALNQMCVHVPWHRDDAQQPTEAAKRAARDYLLDLIGDDRPPLAMTPSVDGGFTFVINYPVFRVVSIDEDGTNDEYEPLSAPSSGASKP